MRDDKPLKIDIHFVRDVNLLVVIHFAYVQELNMFPTLKILASDSGLPRSRVKELNRMLRFKIRDCHRTEKASDFTRSEKDMLLKLFNAGEIELIKNSVRRKW